MAQKLTGVTMETEDRGESGDDLMTSVDINNDLELTDLQLTSGCHGNGDMGRSNNIVTDSTSCETSLKNSKQSVLSSLCLKTETCNIITNANNVPNLEKNI